MDENILIKSGTELALDKHIDFIVNYGKTHDKYVISSFFRKKSRKPLKNSRKPLENSRKPLSSFSRNNDNDNNNADIEGLARRMREYLGPPIGRPAEDHRVYTAFMEACPPRPGVVPGLLASADKRGPSVADRKCKAAIDRVRAERDAAARAVREAEEKAAAEPAAASAAHR